MGQPSLPFVESHPESTWILGIAFQINQHRFLIRQLSGKPDPLDQVFVVFFFKPLKNQASPKAFLIQAAVVYTLLAEKHSF